MVFSRKVFVLKDLKQITVIGLGLLGGSVSLAVSRCFRGVKTVGFTHRAVTRRKAGKLGVCDVVTGDINKSVRKADLVILSTPIYTFEEIFRQISDSLPKGCIVTDVGSTKVLPHRWAAKELGKNIFYVGSHPIAGSEQRGVGFAREDLFKGAMCVLTATGSTNKKAMQVLRKFWSALGCQVKLMTPAEHDRILGKISHLPHITAACLVNTNNDHSLRHAGTGFVDTSRIASGPANIWSDILLANAKNSVRGIDRIIAELLKFKKAISAEDRGRVEQLLESARSKRAAMIKYKGKDAIS